MGLPSSIKEGGVHEVAHMVCQRTTGQSLNERNVQSHSRKPEVQDPGVGRAGSSRVGEGGSFPGPCSSSGVADGPWRSLAGRCITLSLPGSLPGSLGPLPIRTPVTGFRTTQIQSHLPCHGYFFKAHCQNPWVDVNFQGLPSVTAGWVQVVVC